MEKILIIGCPGAGKTTFAQKLSKKLPLPLIHLDVLYWCGSWEHLSREEFDVILQQELEKDRWIIDGNFDRTLPHRLKYCDTVFFFDLPTIECLWGITERMITNYGKQREGMGNDCPERLDKHKLGLYKSVLSFRKDHTRKYHQLLSESGAKVVIFRHRREAEAFLKSIP